MDYIGSKEKLNEWIFGIMLDGIGSDGLVFLDGCAGSGSVSRHAAFNHNFAKIISNDIMEFPSHIVRGAASLTQPKFEQSIDLIIEMNGLPGVKGFFYANYSEEAGRLYFSNDNAAKIDACRIFIEEKAGHDPYIKSYLLYCLLEAFSSVSNTTGIQAAFLKKLKERAAKPIVVRPQECYYKNGLVKTYTKNILSLLKSKKYRDRCREDITYIDPPYNERQYGPNYHLYETLVRYDNPIIRGKTGLRDWKTESKSDFCSKKTCLSFIKEVAENTTARYMFMSYNSDGLLSLDEICLAFDGKIDVFSTRQKRYKADADPKRTYNKDDLQEYLIRITK